MPLLAAFFALLLAAAAPLAAQTPQEIKPTGYVLDYAGVLSPAARDSLTSLCANVDKLAQAQIAVVTVKSLGGQPIEDDSIDLATRLGVGPKASDRGVMILLAVDDRQYRIEVGYGLEGILPDGKVGGFGREAVPFLRDKNYDAALLLLTRRVADTIAADRGVTLPPTSNVPPPQPESEQPVGHGIPGGWISLIVFAIFFGGLFVVPFIASLLGRSGRSGWDGRGNRGGRGSGWYGGPFIGGSGWGGMSGGGFGGSAGGGGFGGFGGGSFGGGGASGSW